VTTADLLRHLPALREMFPREIQMEWPLSEFLKVEQQQRAATWRGLAVWRQSAGEIGNCFQFDDLDE